MERTPHVLCNTSSGTVTGFGILITPVDAGTLSKLR